MYKKTFGYICKSFCAVFFLFLMFVLSIVEYMINILKIIKLLHKSCINGNKVLTLHKIEKI